jgi:phosphotransferase system HPr-like phosphotransfer protein
VGDFGDSGPRNRLVSELEFGAMVRAAPAQSALFTLLDALPGKPDELSRKQYWLLQELTHELETWLDGFGARDNRTWVTYAEINASIRNLSVAAHTLGHVMFRFGTYGVELDGRSPTGESQLVHFMSSLAESTRFLGGSILALVAELRREAERLGATPLPATTTRGHDSEVREFRLLLPPDLKEGKRADGADEIARLLNDYLETVREATKVREKVPPHGASLAAFVAESLTEQKARYWKQGVHSLQSRYDTHVKPTAHHERPELRRLRGHISLAYHLLEVVNDLAHFHERHQSELALAHATISRLVPIEPLLEHAIRFALKWAAEVMLTLEPVVRQLLPQFTRQDTIELALPDGVHLHARPLNLIARVVRKHGKPVEIVVGSEATSANSLMGLILFVGRHPQRRTYSFRGDQAPLKHLQLLFQAGLGEHGLDRLSAELQYLRES